MKRNSCIRKHNCSRQSQTRARRDAKGQFRFRSSILILPRIVQTGRDSVDGRAQRILQFRSLCSQLFAPQKFHLNQAHGIDVGIPQADRAGQHAIAA
jgi:hypothetical protein